MLADANACRAGADESCGSSVLFPTSLPYLFSVPTAVSQLLSALESAHGTVVFHGAIVMGWLAVGMPVVAAADDAAEITPD